MLNIFNPVLNKNEIIKRFSKEKLKFNFFKTSSIKIINIAEHGTDRKDHLTFVNAMKRIKKINFVSSILKIFFNIFSNRNLLEVVFIFLENNLKKNIKILNYQNFQPI